MRTLLALAWGTAACLALVGCGRLGFDSYRIVEPKQDGGADETRMHTARPDADGGGGADFLDAGADAAVRHGDPVGPSDAGLSVPMDDAGVELDGSVSANPADASVSAFSCADQANAIACVSFDNRLPRQWYLDEGTRSDHPSVHDGYLDAHSQGGRAYSYAGCEFSALNDGTLYFRMRVMFPSDGDPSSIDFITVGSYDNNDDYGVELDLVDGKLAFNSSSDGFTYGDFALPLDTWLCIDARLVLDDRQGEMSVNVDGQAALSVSGVDTLPYNGTKLVDLGIDWTRRPEQYAHVLVDDFVLSRDPVTCP